MQSRVKDYFNNSKKKKRNISNILQFRQHDNSYQKNIRK